MKTATPDLTKLNFRFEVAGSVKCNRSWGRINMHQCDHHRLIIVRGGVGELLLPGQTQPVRRGHVIFGLPGEVYGLRQQERKPLVLSVVRFIAYDPTRRVIALPRAFRPGLHCEVKSFLLLEELVLRFTNSVPKSPSCGDGFSVALFRFILWLIHEDRHTGENLQGRNMLLESLRPAVRFIRETKSREPRTAELARLCGLSTSTFVRRMRAGYDLSPKQFIIRQRIERAKTLLLESPYTIEAIARELGYKEPGHFTLQFKKHAGVSPSAFRTSDR